MRKYFDIIKRITSRVLNHVRYYVFIFDWIEKSSKHKYLLLFFFLNVNHKINVYILLTNYVLSFAITR